MGDVVARATQPALAAIKLAWWRERLEELDQGEVPAEPRLMAAARELLPRGIRGADLAQLEEGWAALLEEQPDDQLVVGRGPRLFGLAARLLRAEASGTLDVAGRVYVAGSLVRRGRSPEDMMPVPTSGRVPRALRPVTALAVLARRDLGQREDEATPGRAWALLRHRITGRL